MTVPAMTTTSLKLPDDLKARAAAAAERLGVTPHAFMVEAIRAAALAAQRRASFVSEAAASRVEAMESGKGYVATEVHDYLRARMQGKAAAKPKAKSWRG